MAKKPDLVKRPTKDEEHAYKAYSEALRDRTKAGYAWEEANTKATQAMREYVKAAGDVDKALEAWQKADDEADHEEMAAREELLRWEMAQPEGEKLRDE